MVDYTFNTVVNQRVTFFPNDDTMDFGARSAASVNFATSGNLLTGTSTTGTIGTVTFDSTLLFTSTTLAGFTLTNTHFNDGSVLAVGDLTSDVTVDSGADTIDFLVDAQLTAALNLNNQVNGLAGDDSISLATGTGDNLIFGGLGADTIVAGNGDNTIYGGSSLSDTTDGADTIVVGQGNNVIFGNGGADDVTFSTVTLPGQLLTFYGGQGADSLAADSSGGNFLLNGGPGDDTLTLTNATGNATVYGGVGIDVLDFSGSNAAMTIFGGTSIVDTIDGADTITLGTGNVTVYANAGADRVIANASSGHTDIVYLGKGADSLTSGAASGAFQIYGGTDSDNINLTNHTGNATIFGGNGLIDSTDGADTIAGSSSGNDVIYGNGGNDVITVITDADHAATVYGGAGNDTIAAIPASSGADIQLYGNTGDDMFRLNFTNFNPIIHLLDYGSGKDITQITLSGGDAAHLSVEHTTLHTIISNTGAETLVYDSYIGNFSKTTFVISNGSILETNFDGKAATLGGGAGNDQLIAGEQGDTLTAGAGDDLLTGGSGQDRFAFKTADFGPNDTVSGSGGTDTISLSTSGTAIVDANFINVTHVETLALESGDYSTNGITLGAIASDAGIITINATAASAAHANLSSMTHGITYLGATAIDSVTGSDFADSINGKAGADILIGGGGDDTLTGGDGSDVFAYFQGVQDGTDSILDALFGTTGTTSTNLDKLEFDSSINGLNLGNNNTTVDGAVLTTIVAAGASGTEVIILHDIGIATADISTKLDIINANVAIDDGSVTLFFDTTKGHAVMYYDSNGSTAGGHHQLADFSSITTLAGMDAIDFNDIIFV